MVSPAQIVCGVAVSEMEGSITMTSTVSVPVQPFVSVAVTIYCVLVVGFATGLKTVVSDNAVEGLHVYVRMVSPGEKRQASLIALHTVAFLPGTAIPRVPSMFSIPSNPTKTFCCWVMWMSISFVVS